MKPSLNMRSKIVLLIAAIAMLTLASTRMRADTGTCSGQMITLPFTDVPSSNVFFCAIAEAYFAGLTNGTTPTTYSPSDSVTRAQMAAFVTRTLDQSVKRGSKRAALRQFWTTQGEHNLGLTTVGNTPYLVESDGADLWVANGQANTVSRVRASDGRPLETWTGAMYAAGILVAAGKVFITGETTPAGSLYQIDPTQPAGPVSIVSTNLGAFPLAIAYDGQRIWTANIGMGGTPGISIVTFNPTTVTTINIGFSAPSGILFDGTNIWVSDSGDGTLKKLDASGNILQTVSVGAHPQLPAFDGMNIWAPNTSPNAVSVVRASTGSVVATLSGNGLSQPFQAAFDGERILVTNYNGNSISLWKATDFTPIGTFSTGTDTFPFGACSDGLNFWITLFGTGKLARF